MADDIQGLLTAASVQLLRVAVPAEARADLTADLEWVGRRTDFPTDLRGCVVAVTSRFADAATFEITDTERDAIKGLPKELYLLLPRRVWCVLGVALVNEGSILDFNATKDHGLRAIAAATMELGLPASVAALNFSLQLGEALRSRGVEARGIWLACAVLSSAIGMHVSWKAIAPSSTPVDHHQWLDVLTVPLRPQTGIEAHLVALRLAMMKELSCRPG